MRNSFFIIAFFLLIYPIVVSAEGFYFASLKKNEVNWRRGPGERFPIDWVYQEKGYPVLVLDQYDKWRQVQEVDGSVGWVHQSMLSDKRTALVQEEGNLTEKPYSNSKVVAVVQPGTIAIIEKCPEEYLFCLLSFKHNGKKIKGWFSRSDIWGIHPKEIID